MITDSVHLREANKDAASQKPGRVDCTVELKFCRLISAFVRKKTAVPVPYITELAAAVFLCFINLQERFSAFCSFL